MPLAHKRNMQLFPRRLIWGCYLLNFLSGLAVADELDTLQFNAGINKVYDSNLFRRSNNEVSEQITRSTVGVTLDKTYSLQRIKLDATLVDNKYHENDYLDFLAKNYDGALLWSLTPSFTGTLSSARTQSMNNFGDFRVTAQNVRTMTDNQFTMKYSPHNVWALILGVSQNKLENSATFNAISDFDAKGVDYGFSYDFASGAYLRFLAHNRKGEFLKRPLSPAIAFDNGYTENEYEIDLFFQEIGKNKFSSKIAYLDREYDNFKIRNYDAYIGNINYDQVWTGKLKSTFSLSRLIAPFETETTAYSITDTFRTQLLYEISSKINAGLTLRYAERDFEGRGQFDTSGRVDKERTYGAFVSWNPTKNVGVSLNSNKSNRDSTLSNFDYDDTVTSLNLELKI
jgi:exopolysaccharide biosynthesis operon protein EpsL